MFGIVIAFKNYRAFKPNTFWNNIIKSDWVGLKNFEFLKSPDTAVMIRNTLGYNLLWIVLGLVIAVAFAIMMSELRNRFAAKAYQTMMFFPYFLSWVVASYFVMAFLDPTSGMIPALQKSMGIKPTNFYHDTTDWPLILTLCSMWKNIGYSSVLYLAAITGIDTSLYEAAAVDGATKVAAGEEYYPAQHPHDDYHPAHHERGQNLLTRTLACSITCRRTPALCTP